MRACVSFSPQIPPSLSLVPPSHIKSAHSRRRAVSYLHHPDSLLCASFPPLFPRPPNRACAHQKNTTLSSPFQHTTTSLSPPSYSRISNRRRQLLETPSLPLAQSKGRRKPPSPPPFPSSTALAHNPNQTLCPRGSLFTRPETTAPRSTHTKHTAPRSTAARARTHTKATAVRSSAPLPSRSSSCRLPACLPCVWRPSVRSPSRAKIAHCGTHQPPQHHATPHHRLSQHWGGWRALAFEHSWLPSPKFVFFPFRLSSSVCRLRKGNSISLSSKQRIKGENALCGGKRRAVLVCAKKGGVRGGARGATPPSPRA